jgi:hypothetical protein
MKRFKINCAQKIENVTLVQALLKTLRTFCASIIVENVENFLLQCAFATLCFNKFTSCTIFKHD